MNTMIAFGFMALLTLIATVRVLGMKQGTLKLIAILLVLLMWLVTIRILWLVG